MEFVKRTWYAASCPVRGTAPVVPVNKEAAG